MSVFRISREFIDQHFIFEGGTDDDSDDHEPDGDERPPGAHHQWEEECHHAAGQVTRVTDIPVWTGIHHGLTTVSLNAYHRGKEAVGRQRPGAEGKESQGEDQGNDIQPQREGLLQPKR